MTETITAPEHVEEDVPEDVTSPDVPWIVLVWDDPINTMKYVAYVFRKLFGFPQEKAWTLMMRVHVEGRAVVAHGTKEKAEADVSRLHAYGLWATMQKDH